MIRRRDLITLLGGAAAAWPLAARAQQPERMRRIGVMMNVHDDDPQAQLYLSAFQRGLQELGWTVGRNLRIDHRWGGSTSVDQRFREQVAELVALMPDVIVWAGGVGGDPRPAGPAHGGGIGGWFPAAAGQADRLRGQHQPATAAAVRQV